MRVLRRDWEVSVRQEKDEEFEVVRKRLGG